jgi:hypothetical protein
MARESHKRVWETPRVEAAIDIEFCSAGHARCSKERAIGSCWTAIMERR